MIVIQIPWQCSKWLDWWWGTIICLKISEADMKLNIGMWGENDLLNIFKLYFTDLLVNMIVQETNRYENKHLIAVNREGVCVIRLNYMGQVSFSPCSHIYDELTFRKSKLVCTCSEIILTTSFFSECKFQKILSFEHQLSF